MVKDFNLGFPVTSLFEWGSHNNYLMSNMVYALKQGGLVSANRKLAKLMAHKMEFSNSKEIVIIPAPSGGGQDHAYMLAHSLSQEFKGTLLDIFERKSEAKQKALSRRDRFNKDFKYKEGLGENEVRLRLKNKRVVFVDDVLTTGATAKVAFEKVGKFSIFTASVLLYRSKLVTF